MKLEELEARLQDIENSMKNVIANFNALEGGKQECLYWINKLKAIPKSEETVLTE